MEDKVVDTTPQTDVNQLQDIIQPRNGFADALPSEPDQDPESAEDAALNEFPKTDDESFVDDPKFFFFPLLLQLLKLGPISLAHKNEEHLFFVFWVCQTIASVFLHFYPSSKVTFVLERCLLVLITIFILSLGFLKEYDLVAVAFLIFIDIVQQKYIRTNRREALYCGNLIFILGTGLLGWKFMTLASSPNFTLDQSYLVLLYKEIVAA